MTGLPFRAAIPEICPQCVHRSVPDLRMLNAFKRLVKFNHQEKEFQHRWENLRKRAPLPVIWLFGKTQSGKTSIIKYLTGADEAEIGHGFQACTRHSRQYQFPTAEAPLLTFLDTRGVDEPTYDPAEDLSRFDSLAHVIIVTVKAMDHAQENILRHLRTLRQAGKSRPILLAVTCLHEAYPQQQHVQPYPFKSSVEPAVVPESLGRTLAEQRERFRGLVDKVIPIDLTRPEEGFTVPDYGGEQLKQVLLEVLPHAYRQTLLTLDKSTRELQDLVARRVMPHISGYSTLAATAGAIPIPWLDLLIIPGIQTQMIYHLARLYGQPLTASRFLELAGTLGLGMVVRQATREVVKLIPYVGSVAGSALAGASTFALGKAFCYYYQAVQQGHVPKAADLKHYYREQLAQAEEFWSSSKAQ